MRRYLSSAVIVLLAIGPVTARAEPIVFSSATATFYQTDPGIIYGPWTMIDGSEYGIGWAIANWALLPGDYTQSETALFTLATPLGAGYHELTFKIYQNNGDASTLGDFAIGYTTDSSPNLGSPETEVAITSASGVNGTTFTLLDVGQLLAGGPLPGSDTYIIDAVVNTADPITGFFLNAINDPSNGLPTGGPGRQPVNGNIVVYEFTADIPEPASFALLTGSLLGLAALRRKPA